MRDPAAGPSQLLDAIRIGFGFDSHRIEPGGIMHLGGLSIDCNAHFVGHSDADVLLHAITDALLSAANLPDIGQLFPNNLEENRGRDSAEMLSLAMDQVRETGWELVNLDCVVQLERPKLSPIKKELIERISSVLRTDSYRVSLKGKTGEGTGAIGRGELAEAHCVALIARSTSPTK